MQKIPKSILSLTVYKEAISEEIPGEMWEFGRLDDDWHLTHEGVNTKQYWTEKDVLLLIASVEAFNLALEHGEKI